MIEQQGLFVPPHISAPLSTEHPSGEQTQKLKWQYYPDIRVDEKAVRWLDREADDGQKREAMWKGNDAFGSARTIFHVNCTYEVSIADMTQRDMTSGVVHKICRISEVELGSRTDTT